MLCCELKRCFLPVGHGTGGDMCLFSFTHFELAVMFFGRLRLLANRGLNAPVMFIGSFLFLES